MGRSFPSTLFVVNVSKWSLSDMAKTRYGGAGVCLQTLPDPGRCKCIWLDCLDEMKWRYGQPGSFMDLLLGSRLGQNRLSFVVLRPSLCSCSGNESYSSNQPC
ncbi:hypothetical protein DPEC_G00226110 [Dallia pectoralis]|uniref:Uncharacterized protein n=1 Tax=Dallia pectoralis TaxID=75939 RepID=A0ACC2G0B9_DALPE|nr:hypothetical protein DPEC_G00226110 [Dallia pectoralis]